MVKPDLKVEPILYSSPYDPDKRDYTVYVVDGAHHAPFAQMHTFCPYCGVGHIYRYYPDYWVALRCPTCKGHFKFYEPDSLMEDDEEIDD